MFSLIVTPLIVYSLFLSIHWIPFRFGPIRARTLVMTLCLVAVSPLVYPVYELTQSVDKALAPAWVLPLTAVFTGMLFYLLWCGYVQFFFAFNTSPSLRCLVEILESNEGCLSEERLVAQYPFEDVFRRRLDRLVQAKTIEISKDRSPVAYQASAQARFWGELGDLLKRFFNFGQGG